MLRSKLPQLSASRDSRQAVCTLQKCFVNGEIHLCRNCPGPVGISDHIISADPVLQILLDPEASHCCGDQFQKDHTEGNRENDNCRLFLISSQIRKRHTADLCSAPGFLFSLSFQISLGVFHCLYGGNISRQLSRFPAADQHRKQGKYCPEKEDPGAEAKLSIRLIAGHLQRHRHQDLPREIAQDQTCRNTCDAQLPDLSVYQGTDLPFGGSDGFQKPVKADFLQDGKLEYIIDDQISGQQDDQKSGCQQYHGFQIHTFHPGVHVCPVDAVLHRLIQVLFFYVPSVSRYIAGFLDCRGDVLFYVSGVFKKQVPIDQSLCLSCVMIVFTEIFFCIACADFLPICT